MNRAPAGTGLVCDTRYRAHRTGPFHPESPARLEAVEEALRSSGLLDRCRRIAPREASEADLLRCHTPEHLAGVRRDEASGIGELSSGDTTIGPGSERVARLAAGGLLAAADALMAGEVRNALALVRPPGHHATPERGMGFCIYNNVAVAARYLQAVHGLERILIADWDVHHGNGTQEIFWRDPSVLYLSSHQSPLYPGSGAAGERGEGPGLGFTRNCPLPAGSGGAELLAAWRRELLPAAEAFAPQAVLISAGFDARRGDPLANLRLEDGDFAVLTRELMAVADRHARGRLLSSLEGGYALEGLAAAVCAHLEVLLSG
jgi:acetoin utilization deacetylase AcuC-like enzyme